MDAEELREIHAKHERAEQAKTDRKAKAQNWIETRLGPAFTMLESKVRDKEFRQYLALVEQKRPIKRSSLERTLRLQFLPGSLEFHLLHGREPYVSYTVKLEVSLEGVTGHTTFMPPSGKGHTKPVKNILEWTQDKIIEDFWEEYKGWQSENK